MRKLVLGIMALISVQFAFVTYMMVLKSHKELTDEIAQTETSRIRPIDRTRNDDLKKLPETHEPTTVASPPEPRHSMPGQPASNARERFVQKRRPASDRVFNVPAFSAARSAEPVEFKNVVIRYNRDANDFNCETPQAPKTKKRSYIAKAFPVIKKPWDWLKAIGSKLN